MSVVVSVIFGFILLVAVTFVVPNDKAARRPGPTSSPTSGTTSMSKHWAEFLLFIAVRRAGLLHDRLDDLGLADDVRVLA